MLAADCFNCDILDTVVPGGWFGSLAVFFVFCIFLSVSRAFYSWTYLAKISSALSIPNSSSGSATAMVTDFANAGCCLLDEGHSSS